MKNSFLWGFLSTGPGQSWDGNSSSRNWDTNLTMWFRKDTRASGSHLPQLSFFSCGDYPCSHTTGYPHSFPRTPSAFLWLQPSTTCLKLHVSNVFTSASPAPATHVQLHHSCYDHYLFNKGLLSLVGFEFCLENVQVFLDHIIITS